MEITVHETFHKFSKGEKGASSQWYICSSHSSLRALEERYYLKYTFEYLLQSEEYLVQVKMLNAYNYIVISSLF